MNKSKWIKESLCCVSALALLAACTQAPSDVQLKGQNRYGKDTVPTGNAAPIPSRVGASTYIPPSPIPTTVEKAAPAQAIGVNDLAPPQAAPVPPAKPAAPANNGINPWTNKPHFSDSMTSTDLPPPSQPQPAQNDATVATAAPVAKLDQVIGNDDGSKPAAPAEAKTANPSAKGFIWPVATHKIISGFGPKGGGKINDGINIAAGDGEPVWAASDGEVVYAGNQLEGYGNMVVIKHAGGKVTSYAHLSKMAVDKYDRVKQGDVIGYVGTTGGVKEPQLHFAVRNGKEPVDPQKVLAGN